MLGEALRVDRGRGDDDLEVGAGGQQPLEVAEDEVDVQAALVGLVDDQGVVAP